MTKPLATICVDLDGTLIRSDVLLESLLQLLKTKPWLLLCVPIWLLRGKAWLKHQLALRTTIEPDLLPYNNDLLLVLRQLKDSGHTLALSTASHQKPAQAIADYLGIFDSTLASTPENNLSGANKRAAMDKAFGDGNYCYVGNDKKDLAIWSHCQQAMLVNTNKRVRSAALKHGNVIREFADNESSITQILKAMRIYQWPKNLLLFVSLVMAHQINNYSLLIDTVLGFLAFSLCASSAYLINDLLDLNADRRNSNKCTRPFASGTLPLSYGVVLSPLSLVLAFYLASLLPVYFSYALACYFIVTLLYSFRLKRAAIADCITLAGLYTLRIIAGATIMSAEPSFWLMAFSMFIFTSLATAKRFAEIAESSHQPEEQVYGRGYKHLDADTLASLGITSGYLSVLVLALYINSPEVVHLYSHPDFIWLLCPLLLYWVSRVWLLTRRGEMHQDPVLFALSDRVSYFVAILALFILWSAT